MAVYLWIAIGGALGSVARHWLSVLAAAWLGEAFPWGTLAVNTIGSLAIGLLASWGAEYWAAAPGLKHFLIVGLCGGFTTFSAFSWQTFRLMQQGAWLAAVLNILGSVTVCLAAVWFGAMIGGAFQDRG